MMTIIYILAGLLILTILYMLFRISTLMSVAKNEDPDEVGSGNGIHALLFMAFMIVGFGTFFWYSYAHFDSYTLPLASEHGAETDYLWWVTMAIVVVAFTLISVIKFYFLYKYQYKKGRTAKFYPDNHYLEMAWTIIPAIVLTVLVIAGLSTWNQIMSPASKDAEVIELVAQQFAWAARYPGVNDKQLGKYSFKKIDNFNEFGLDLTDANSYDDFKSLELHIPAGKEVLLKIRAKDVLHSVFLPHFRVKMDAVPGMQTQFKFVATLTTEQMRTKLNNPDFNYELACTEICGRGHFSMRMPVVVDDEATYNKWKASQEAWLKQNPDYLDKVPENLREKARISAGIVVSTTDIAEVKE